MRIANETKEEFSVWFSIVWPVALTILCRFSMSIIDLSFVGHLEHDPRFPNATSTDFLVGASLATVWFAITVIILMGFQQALNTLCSQAIGAQNPKLAGVWLQIGVFFLFLSCLPVGLSWFYVGTIANAALQSHCNSQCAELANTFARYSLFWLFPQAVFTAVTNYFQSQEIVKPALVVAVPFVGVNIALNQLLIHGSAALGWRGLGFVGSPIATSCTRIGQLVVYLAYTVGYRRYHARSWPGWGCRHFTRARCGEYLGQALPMAFGQALEEWQLQLVVFFAGRLGAAQLATQNSMYQLFFFFTSFMYGVTRATVVRIGSHLGHGRIGIAAAKRVIRIASVAAAALGIAVALLFVLGRHLIGHIFSRSPVVWQLTAEVSWLAGAGYAFLSLFYVSMATLSGQARPGWVAGAFFVGAWLVSVPLSYLLAFTAGMGLQGLWLGLMLGYCVVTAIAGYGVWSSDWNAVADAAQLRSERGPASGLESSCDTATSPFISEHRLRSPLAGADYHQHAADDVQA